jgi:hypothetical protein
MPPPGDARAARYVATEVPGRYHDATLERDVERVELPPERRDALTAWARSASVRLQTVLDVVVEEGNVVAWCDALRGQDASVRELIGPDRVAVERALAAAGLGESAISTARVVRDERYGPVACVRTLG